MYVNYIITIKYYLYTDIVIILCKQFSSSLDEMQNCHDLLNEISIVVLIVV